jgi:hypothetical protein
MSADGRKQSLALVHRPVADADSHSRDSSGHASLSLSIHVHEAPMPMTRLKSIQMWFAAVAFVVVPAAVFGAAVTLSTAAMFVALALAPPVLVLLMWPGDQPLAATAVSSGMDRRSCGRGHEGAHTPVHQQRNGRRSA